MLTVLAAFLLNVAPAIDSGKDIEVTPITKINAQSHVWRILDKAHNVVCYLILPERSTDAPATMQCVRLNAFSQSNVGEALKPLFVYQE